MKYSALAELVKGAKKMKAPYALPAAGAAGLAAMAAPGESEAGIGGVLAKTANRDMLKIAEQAEKQGLNASRIYDATGWARGADGKWRWEFDDSTAKLAEDYVNAGRTSQEKILDNPQLYNNYQDTRNITTKVSVDPEDRQFASFNADGSIDARGVDEKSLLSLLLHEDQHGIQRREGFDIGGSPSGNDVYRRLSAEVEARNVQRRMDMTPDDRRMLPFWQTEDVPRSQQIVRNNVTIPLAAVGLTATGSSFADTLDPISEMEINRRKRIANSQAMTHQPQRVPGQAEQSGRDFLSELFNPANWLPTLAGASELGRPEDLVYRNGEWVTQ